MVLKNEEEKIQKMKKIFMRCSYIDSMALGGSRARGVAKEGADFDFFCLIKDDGFIRFRNEFVNFLIKNCAMVVAAEFFYLENWGYLFKSYDHDFYMYDICILPISRVDEMGIKSSNRLLFDKSGLYLEKLGISNDDYYEQSDLANYKRRNIIDSTVIELLNLLKVSIVDSEFWECVKYIERIRRNIMILMRMNKGKIGKKFFSPEKGFLEEIGNRELIKLYKDNYTGRDLYYRWKDMLITCCNVDESVYVKKILSNAEYKE